MVELSPINKSFIPQYCQLPEQRVRVAQHLGSVTAAVVDVGGAGLDSPPEQRCVSAKGEWGRRSAAPRWNFGLSGMGTGAMEAWKAGRGRTGFFFTMGAHVMNFIEWHGDTSDESGSR
jgi:hypothetical protein